jgi:hypothetical protein
MSAANCAEFSSTAAAVPARSELRRILLHAAAVHARSELRRILTHVHPGPLFRSVSTVASPAGGIYDSPMPDIPDVPTLPGQSPPHLGWESAKLALAVTFEGGIAWAISLTPNDSPWLGPLFGAWRAIRRRDD